MSQMAIQITSAGERIILYVLIPMLRGDVCLEWPLTL